MASIYARKLAGQVEQKHPPAPGPERTALERKSDEHEHAKSHKRHTYDPTSCGVEPIGNGCPKGDGPDSEEHHHGSVSQHVKRADEHTPALRVLGGRNVSYGDDMIPVDAVAKAEEERRCDETEGDACGGVHLKRLPTTTAHGL